ncbi:hypothetical protein Q1695_014828 [Nippostrongylus brasiliensis]|nr:hypothetical protein Q1695_014828 [Nippostrongylus brasiliensis]
MRRRDEPLCLFIYVEPPSPHLLSSRSRAALPRSVSLPLLEKAAAEEICCLTVEKDFVDDATVEKFDDDDDDEQGRAWRQ